jgi:hypothetical protein
MPVQPHLIAQAADYLTNEKGTPRQKLILGGKLLWAARTFGNGWTPELMVRANNVCRGLSKDGITAVTVKWMKDETVEKCLKELTKEVVELAVQIERRRLQG